MEEFRKDREALKHDSEARKNYLKKDCERKKLTFIQKKAI